MNQAPDTTTAENSGNFGPQQAAPAAALLDQVTGLCVVFLGTPAFTVRQQGRSLVRP